MKKLLSIAVLSASMLFITDSGLKAQGVLRKLKEKANQAIDKAIGNEVEKKTGLPTGQSSETNSGNGSSNPSNKGGGGLSNTEPPDVKLQMAEASAAGKSGRYSEARYSIQQALMGVEIQLGREILKSLPPTVSALPADIEKDKVSSMKWGWSNLTIQRVYNDKSDKQMTITIGNAGMYSGLAQMYFANAGMVEANNQDQNMKQIRVKGNKGIIQYDDRKGYTIMIQLGQSSGIVWEFINFNSEQQVMDAANSFDIDGIKKLLGEQ